MSYQSILWALADNILPVEFHSGEPDMMNFQIIAIPDKRSVFFIMRGAEQTRIVFLTCLSTF